MDKVQEIMGLVDAHAHHERMQDSEAVAQCREFIETALRELVEREPLSDDEAVKLYESWDYGLLDDEAYKVIRAVESAHGIWVK